jgi:hypothetical protein
VKIEIDVDQRDAKVLFKWASVLRTLQTAKRTAEEAAVECMDKSVVDDAELVIEELTELMYPLNALHRAFKEAVRNARG